MQYSMRPIPCMNDPSPGGLTTAQALARLAAEGPNALPPARRGTLAAIALEVMREPMFLLLAAAAAIYLVLGDVREALVLAASVLVVVAITVAQRRKTERALEALRDLSSPRASVLRDGVAQRIAGADVVRGDLLLLSEGDRVPADGQLVSVNDFTVDESLLTGESLPVEKQAVATQAERAGRVYSGTLVTRGQARALVSATGPRTEFGRIGLSLASLGAEPTMLQRETARVVKLIAAVALALCVVVALLYFALRGDALAGVLAGLTLAMAILPEEFPVVLTVFLALGAWRIGRRGVLTRHMPAVEMLGAATVLCVDKTGTLTENRMALAETRAASGATEAALLETAALACELEPFDPMDRAILAGAQTLAPRASELRRSWRLERDYPLTTDFRAMCHGWRAPHGALRLAIKGAPETVLALCGLDETAKRRALEDAQEAASRGLRLLAVATADWRETEWPEHPRAVRFTSLGFVALADPLRASVPAAVAECRRAGIRVVMITGDYPGTARAIAEQAGLAHAEVLSGEALAAMSDEALAQAVRRVNVFARILPEQKLRLVTAFKAAGEVVAMTGDGVNDAPALKASHIGIAMGRRGTDVARESAALVLLEDDFGSIVATVRMGRRIYENIRNAMRYIIAVHVPTVGMSFLPLVLGWPLFLFPVHVVFLEFVIDPACSIVFEAEASDDNAMERPPRNPQTPLFDREMLVTGLGLGASVLAAVFAVYWWGQSAGRAEGELRALGFAAIVFGNVALILANRSRDRSIVATLGRSNPALWWVVLGTLAALAAAIYVPLAAEIFRFAPLGAGDLLLALAAGAAGVVWFEIVKLRARPALH
jgi:P-type Ca2+ transporter type 2C